MEQQDKYIGQKFSQLTVASFVRRSGKHTYYRCQCDCGVFVTREIWRVKTGRAKACRTCGLIKHHRSTFRDCSGERIGYLTVICRSGKDWLCKCDCGKETIVEYTKIIKKKNKSCGCKLRYQKGQLSGVYRGIFELSGHKIASARYGAKSRGLEFSVSKEELWEQFLLQDKRCIFTNKELRMDGPRGGRAASLDRIDSSKGYTKDNIQWVCQDINRMKWTSSTEKFIENCILVAKFQKDKQYKKKYKSNYEVPAWYINAIRSRTKWKKLSFNLTKKYLESLLKKQSGICLLSGQQIDFTKRGPKPSLDRIDSKKGYVKENVQWITGPINKMKMRLSFEEFVDYCNAVSAKYD